MRINNLQISNFKRFDRYALDLHPQFTLLVGDNGMGKTTLLDALAVAAGVWLVDPPDSSLRNSGRNILPGEIRLEPVAVGDRIQFRECKPVVVEVDGVIDGNPVNWRRQIRDGGSRTSNSDSREALSLIGDLYRRDRSGEQVVCPVVAYYGAGRAWLPSNKRAQSVVEPGPARRWDAFYDCFDERIRIPELHAWFLRELIAAANRGGRWRPGYEAVKRVILRCLPEADDLSFDGDRQAIVLSLAGRPQPFGNLSAGQKMMVALVADIAIKAVTQNAHLLPPDALGAEDEPWPRVLAQAPGLVLIDEIDVHLHPKWQRRVVADLQGAFPAMQFVATTHSPQTIGEVLAESIRLLKEGEDYPRRPTISYGVDSNWVLDHVMPEGASRDGRMQELIDRIEDLLDAGEFDEAEARLIEVRQLMQGEDGELTGLQSNLEALRRLADEED